MRQVVLLIITLLLIGCGTNNVNFAALEPSPTSPPPTEAPVTDSIPLAEANSVTFHSTTIDGTTVEYALVLPASFEEGKGYPVLLALPPGPQTRSMVDAGLDGYWTQPAQARGWIVVSPIAPDGQLFFQGSEAVMPEFLRRVAATYPPENGRFHIAGISNGGLSAFRIALNHPDLFHSVLGIPGFPQTAADFAKLDQIVDIPIFLIVGEEDTRWLEEMEKTAVAFEEMGGSVTFNIAAGEGHVVRSISGDALYDYLDSTR